VRKTKAFDQGENSRRPKGRPLLAAAAAELSCRPPCHPPAAALPLGWLASRGGSGGWRLLPHSSRSDVRT